MSDPTAAPREATGLPTIDVHEYGGKREGVRQQLDRRLFMQLLVYEVDGSPDAYGGDLARRLAAAKVASVIYADAADPSSFGLLTWSEDPAHFVKAVRPHLQASALRPRRDFTMLGRTYGLGHEPDLEHALLRRSVDYVSDPATPWHVWYPLRRTGEFAAMEPHEQSVILREHAHIGMAYGQQGLAHDIRLACHGLDAGDNEFVIGITSSSLHPISHLIQAMRKTRQTREFIAKMGPFFVGYVTHRTG